MSEERIAALEASLRAVTDQVGGIIDQVQQKGFVPAFRCGHSGLLLPVNYVKDWGKGFGIGLGPHPVSEVWDTDYDTPPPNLTNDIRRMEQIAHPSGPSFAQVDLVMASPEDWRARRAILATEDPDGFERGIIVRNKQMENPRSQLRIILAGWKGAR